MSTSHCKFYVSFLDSQTDGSGQFLVPIALRLYVYLGLDLSLF